MSAASQPQTGGETPRRRRRPIRPHQRRLLQRRLHASEEHAALQRILEQHEPDSMIVAVPDEHVALVAQHGALQHPTSLRFLPGLPQACHENCHVFALFDARMRVQTGYALSSDGLWRCHSWLLAGDGVVVETTLARDAYFGIACPCERCRVMEDRTRRARLMEELHQIETREAPTQSLRNTP